MNHPDLAQLWEYLEGPATAPQAATLDHLTECTVCRTRAARLATLQNQLQLALPRLGATAHEDGDALDVARWVDAAADAGHDFATDPRAQNPAWLKAALHYAVHCSALQRELPTLRSTPPPRAKHAGVSTSLVQRMANLFTLRAPVWIPAATAAALVWAALGLPLLTTDHPPAGPLPLAFYQDAPIMRFQSADAARPGIGFFAAANVTERPFSGVHLMRSQARVLDLRWPAVENATQYRVALYRSAGQTRESIAEQVVTITQARFSDFDFTANRRYEWEISGSTRDGATFRASGGFVVP